MVELARRAGSFRDRLLKRYILFTTPTASGLPNWRVVTWFPVLAALGTVVLVVLHLSGTSSGMHWLYLGTGHDPRLIFGNPKAIRGDEWYVQQSWVVSQSNTGYGAVNPTFPGGSDMTFLNELPSWDWSSLFRPHLWGYLLFGLDAGIAWHWWLPALGLVSGCYLFVVTMLPRRAITAALFAAGMFFTPLLQWFYTPSSVWPVAWACLTLAGIVWILTDKRLWVRVTWSAIIGYVAITMAMGLYVPFILPGIYVVLAFAVGYALRVRVWQEIGVRRFVRRIAPLLTAGLLAMAVTAMWVWSRWSTFVAFQSTVYPGERRVATGTLTQGDPYLAGIGGAPWNLALRFHNPSILGANPPEGASVILLCVFLLPGLVWIAFRSIGRGRRPDWLVLCCLAVLFLILAFLLIPGWDGLAHVLLLDRIAPERWRIVFIPLLPLFAVLVIDHVDRRPPGVKDWKLGLLSASFTTGIMGALLSVIVLRDRGVLGLGGGDNLAPAFVIVAMTGSVVAVLAIVLATFLFFVRRMVPLAAALVMVTTVPMIIGVNPVYRGIYDLSETNTGREVMRIDHERDGMWLGIGSIEPAAILTETGVGSYSGVQNYPSKEMWKEIDPESRYEAVWNRLAHISWESGTGEPVVTLIQTDIVFVTFDACSRFAQGNVDYVLSDDPSIDTDCLAPIETIEQGPSTMTIYEVVPAE
jgi:hypothetical protein